LTGESLGVEREPDRLNLDTSSGNKGLELVGLFPKKKTVQLHALTHYNISSTYSDLDIVIFEDEGSVNDSKFSRHAKIELERISFHGRMHHIKNPTESINPFLQVFPSFETQ
jgi:hypothetical protein